MNTFTNLNDFIDDAQFILNNSKLLIKNKCVIHNDVLYEKLDDHHHTYRFFFSIDDYDYLENQQVIDELNTSYNL
jgi:hypothetical protein